MPKVFLGAYFCMGAYKWEAVLCRQHGTHIHACLFCMGVSYPVYSGAPPIRTLLGPSASGWTIKVSSSQGLLTEHGWGLLLKSMI